MYRVQRDGFFGELFLPEEDKYPGKALICFSGSAGRQPSAGADQRRGGDGSYEHRVSGLQQGQRHRFPAGKQMDLPRGTAALHALSDGEIPPWPGAAEKSVRHW